MENKQPENVERGTPRPVTDAQISQANGDRLPEHAAHATGEHIMQFFRFAHLPPSAQAVSAPFWDLACVIVGTIPRNPERTVALRKLLESKDAAVRAFLAKAD